jgi:hypothetical protein
MFQFLHVGDLDLHGRARRNIAEGSSEDISGLRKLLEQCRALTAVFRLFVRLAGFSFLLDQAIDSTLPYPTNKVDDTDAIEQWECVPKMLDLVSTQHAGVLVPVARRSPDLIEWILFGCIDESLFQDCA